MAPWFHAVPGLAAAARERSRAGRFAPGPRISQTGSNAAAQRIHVQSILLAEPLRTTMLTTPPERTEAAEYYFTYINQVPAGHIVDILDAQAGDYVALLKSISEEQSFFRYEADKWSIREVAAHIN